MLRKLCWPASVMFGQVQELLRSFSKRRNKGNFHFNSMSSFFLLPITINCFAFVLIERKGTQSCIFSHFYSVYTLFYCVPNTSRLQWQSTLEPSVNLYPLTPRKNVVQRLFNTTVRQSQFNQSCR